MLQNPLLYIKLHDFCAGESELSNRGSIKIHKIKLVLRVFFLLCSCEFGGSYCCWRQRFRWLEGKLWILWGLRFRNCDFCVWDVGRAGDGWENCWINIFNLDFWAHNGRSRLLVGCVALLYWLKYSVFRNRICLNQGQSSDIHSQYHSKMWFWNDILIINKMSFLQGCLL